MQRFLHLGFDEAFRTFKELPQALFPALARREAVHAAITIHAASLVDGVPGKFEGLFPNLYDWIYVINVSEDGTFTFETVNPALGAGSGFLNPDFCGRRPEDCLPKVSGPLLCSYFQALLSEGRPLQFEEEHPVDGRSRQLCPAEIPRGFHVQEHPGGPVLLPWTHGAGKPCGSARNGASPPWHVFCSGSFQRKIAS